MKNLSKIKFQSRADLVVDKITNSIINGELSDGELLPPENRLCEIFGVSRSILREAIRVLASKGLVEVKQGRGTSARLPEIDIPEEAVSNYMKANKFSLLQLMEVRAPIELEVARLAAERRGDAHLALLEDTLGIMRSETRTVEEWSDADESFHKTIIDASGNLLFGIMCRSIIGNIHISRQLAIRHFGIEVVIEEHDRILTAIRRQDPAKAVREMKNHMKGALDRINRVNELLKGRE